MCHLAVPRSKALEGYRRPYVAENTDVSRQPHCPPPPATGRPSSDDICTIPAWTLFVEGINLVGRLEQPVMAQAHRPWNLRGLMENAGMADRRTTLLATLAAWLVWTGAPQAHAGPTSAQKCESAIGIASGKYALCLQKAQAKYALVGDVTGRDGAITKCDQKFEKAYAKAFDKFGASCPTAEPVESFKTHLAECSDATADAVGGSFPPASTCGNGVLEGDERCDQWGTDMSLAPGVSCVTEGDLL